MGSKGKARGRSERESGSPGKIFIGGLHRDTTMATFMKHFGKYGEITDSVIMKDKYTDQPRGFGFVTYADASIVDRVIEDTHIINGKQVEIKRTIPKGATDMKDLKTKKIFVGGIPVTLTDDDFKNFFAKHGNVVEHEIIRDHDTNRSRGFGFVVFDSEDSVDRLLSNGNMIDLAGSKVEIKKAEPKRSSNHHAAVPAGNSSRFRSYGDDFHGYSSSYGGGIGSSGGFGPSSYRTPAGHGDPMPPYLEYGLGNEFSRGYGGELRGYQGSDPPHTFSGRYGPYSGGSYEGGFGSGYSSFGGYQPGPESFNVYGGSSGHAGGYDDSYLGRGRGGGSSIYGSRGGYAGSTGRYHPYGR